MGRGKRQGRPGGLHLAQTEYGDLTAELFEDDQQVRLSLNGLELAKLPLDTFLDPDCSLLAEDGSLVLVGSRQDVGGRRDWPRARLSKADLDVVRGLLRSGEPLATSGVRTRTSSLASY
jgi:hypothetical protein